MNREVHVRFWESVEVRLLRATQLSDRLRRRPRCHREPSALLPVLQSGADAPIPGLSDSGSGLLHRGSDSNRWKTGHGDDRVATRSSIVGPYGANIFRENPVKRKIWENEPIGSWEKPEAFPKILLAQQECFFNNYGQKIEATSHLIEAIFLS